MKEGCREGLIQEEQERKLIREVAKVQRPGRLTMCTGTKVCSMWYFFRSIQLGKCWSGGGRLLDVCS